jgi:hypothetical protein
MQRPPFKEVEASREAFDQHTFKVTKTPNPNWDVGLQQDGSHHQRGQDFTASRPKVVYSPADLNAGENYKMIV